MSLVFFNEALNQDLVSMDMVSINMDVKFQVINMVNAKLVLNMDYVLNMDWVHNMHVFKVLNMDVKKVINMVVIYLPQVNQYQAINVINMDATLAQLVNIGCVMAQNQDINDTSIIIVNQDEKE